MDTVTRVKNASSPQDALVALAQAIDNVYAALKADEDADPWGTWEPQEEPEVLEGQIVDDGEGNVTIDVKPPSEEKQAARLKFAEQIKLDPQYHRSYAKAGPALLYHTDREFVMGLPESYRRLMVQDAMEEDPKFAQHMGRDILKDPSAGDGPKSFEDL